VAEWSKALAWKVSMGQKLIQGSNPCRSATLMFQGNTQTLRQKIARVGVLPPGFGLWDGGTR
jgi:hypothetical protein